MKRQIQKRALHKMFFIVVGLSVIGLMLASCGGGESAETAQGPEATSADEFYLNPYRQECEVDGTLQMCYVASRAANVEFTTYSGTVENLEYEWGNAYALRGSGDGNVFQVEEVLSKTAEPGGVHFPLTITGGGGRIVQLEDGVFELYGEKKFTCDPNDSCGTLDRVIDRNQPITFEFETPPNPADPLILLEWASEAVPAQVGEEPGMLVNNWTLASFTVEKNEERPLLAGTEVTADIALDDSLSSGTISGNAGCNDYSATVTISGNAIKVENMKRGEVQCNDPPGVMEQEQLFLSALTVADSFLVDNGHLAITYNSGNSALNLITAGQ